VTPYTGAAGAAIVAGYANTKNQNISVDIKVPDTLSASVLQKLDDRWDLLGDLTWTGWSKIQEIRIKMTAAGATDDVTNWKLRDTLRLSLGANYKYADNMKFRFGVAYDQSPVPDQYRTVRLPDNDRTWLTAGMQYKPNKQSTIDVGLAYIWAKDTSINNYGEVAAAPPYGYPRGLLQGSYDSSVRILSAQYSYNF
jgi:long-chain fatty acid transport protein